VEEQRMHEDTDDGLIDVGGISLSDLSSEMEETALEHALRRILAASEEHERHNFQAII
jgi:FXSXX-COOH protein